jgi:adenylosuccinate synthase
MVNGVDFWAMTKLDVLDDVPSIKICVAYRRDDGHIYETFPADLRALERCTPVYEEMPGWMIDTSKTTRYEDLPLKAKAYVERLVALSGARLGILSVGPARESTLRLGI